MPVVVVPTRKTKNDFSWFSNIKSSKWNGLYKFYHKLLKVKTYPSLYEKEEERNYFSVWSTF